MRAGHYRLLRAAGHRQMPWKNGLGVTTEISVEPAGSTLAAFDWRISMARIDAGGPFSVFPDTDRLLMVLEGHVHLAIQGQPALRLTPEDEAVKFAGELAVMATLTTRANTPAQPAIDLNVMVRRGRYEPQMRRLLIQRQRAFVPTADITAFVCRTAGLQIAHEQGVDILERDDAVLVCGPASRPFQFTHDGTATLYAIELKALR